MSGISSNTHVNYYCLDCFHSYKLKSTLEKHTNLCKDHTFCKTKFPTGANVIKKHKHGSNSITINDYIYVDLECLLVKYDTCNNNVIKSRTTNIADYIP